MYPGIWFIEVGHHGRSHWASVSTSLVPRLLPMLPAVRASTYKLANGTIWAETSQSHYILSTLAWHATSSLFPLGLAASPFQTAAVEVTHVHDGTAAYRSGC